MNNQHQFAGRAMNKLASAWRASQAVKAVLLLTACVLLSPVASYGQAGAVPIIGTVDNLKLNSPSDVWSGGVIVVGGQVVILPSNMIIELPANFLSLQQLFAQAPAHCVALGESGLAGNDECLAGGSGAIATVLANKTVAGDVIAGYVFLEKGRELITGRISFVNHTDGYFRLNGKDLDDTTGVMIRVNDPDGRHTIQQGKGCAGGPNCSPDPRYTNDPDNYTVTFTTGYPACIPSTIIGGNRTVGSDATGTGDPFCPASNRNVDPVPDSTRFARIQVGDGATVTGNFETINGVRFLSAFDVLVHDALRTADDPTQPDYLIFDEAEWDVAGFQNERARVLLIGFSSHPESQLDIFSLHVDPATNDNHEVPLGSTVGNPLTIRQGIGAAEIGIFKIRYDVDFFEGAPVRAGLSPCENLQNAGLHTCVFAANLGPEFSIVSPITREIIARSRHKQAHPELVAFDIRGRSTTWGEYLTPVGVGHPEFVEINLDALDTPFIFAGEPWNLDRRIHPGGCVDTNGDGVVDCELSPQPLSPFPFSGLDPRTQAAVPFSASDRIISAYGVDGPATVVMPWPPVDPTQVNAVAICVDITRATYQESADGTTIDVWAVSELGGDLEVSGTNLTTQLMIADGTGKYYSHLTLPAGVTVPSSVTVTHLLDGFQATHPLIDEVALVTANYDVETLELTITGTSSTTSGSSSLRLETGDPIGSDGEISIIGIMVPPATVSLSSDGGGSETRKVIVEPTPPDTITVTSADFNQTVAQWTITGTSSVPGPGNAMMLFLGQPVFGQLIGAVDVDTLGNWTIVSVAGSEADPNAIDASSSVSAQSMPRGGSVLNVLFTRSGTVPLTAKAGDDQIVAPGELIQLDGVASSGGVTTYQWLQTDGVTVVLTDATSATPTFTFPTDPVGISLRFQLTVTNATGSSVDSVTIFGFDPSAIPLIAVPALEQTIALAPDPNDPNQFPQALIILGSVASEGVVETYQWTQSAGPSVTLGALEADGTITPDSTLASPAFIATTPPGLTVFSFDLTITGPAGLSTGSVEVPLVFTPPPVTANAGPDMSTFSGEKITLDASGSTGQGLTYLWTQISGPPLHSQSTSIQDPTAMITWFFYPGLAEPLIFQLEVTDFTGISATDTITISRLTLPAMPSLKTVVVPEPSNLLDFVKNKQAAIQLGKAFFWDMQAGSDGVQACGTCHYRAGADARFRNTLHRGANAVADTGGPNYELEALDYPLFNDDITGSQGVVRQDFVGLIPGDSEEQGNMVFDSVHNVSGLNTRQTTGRQAPSVINAVFNVRGFWDGRANYVFNGVNPFGRRDPNNPTIHEALPDGTIVPLQVELEKSSLASQAVGPANSSLEMIWNGRTLADLGRKLLQLQPLAKQIVDPTDSVLGTLVSASGQGLNTTYEAMIQAAFHDRFWNSTATTPDGLSLLEANFSLIWGLSIQVYEATLVSDNSPFDQWREGNETALSAAQKAGFEIFMNQGLCFECHVNAEFTGATVSNVIIEDPTEHMMMADGNTAVYDNAFYNVGVRLTNNDLGIAGTDPFGNPLSFVQLSQNGVVIGPPMLFEPEIDPNLRSALNGAFKTPSLRNVELTGPYFHAGVFQTLEQVVSFYTRGGDFIQENIADADTSVRELPLSPEDRSNLVAFMKSLTDERVRLQQAPFDHPQIFIPHGHAGNDLTTTDNGFGAAVDCMVEISAVGAAGGAPVGTTSTACLPICGNNLLDVDEGCDDGNVVDGDGCLSSCQCEVTIIVDIHSHGVGAGSYPGTTKDPMVGVEVCSYDDSLVTSCVKAVCGGHTRKSRTCIATTCESVACCTTDETGRCPLYVPAGNYVIVAYDATETTLSTPLGANLGDLYCGDVITNRLKQIVRSDGRKMACKTTRLRGSDLLIMEPEYMLWDGTEQDYPFVFEADGDWDVTTAVAPPEGFISDNDLLLQAILSGTEEAVQFTITEVGSDLVPTGTTFTVEHNGVRQVIQSAVDISLTPKYARSRGFIVTQLRDRGLIEESKVGRSQGERTRGVVTP